MDRQNKGTCFDFQGRAGKGRGGFPPPLAARLISVQNNEIVLPITKMYMQL